jgi:hypothetical protein
MIRTIRTFVIVASALAFAATTSAAQSAQKPDAKRPAESPAGKWMLSVETPHGSMDFGLTIQLEGSKVKGALSTPQNGDIAIAGDYTGGTLTFKFVEAPDGYPALAFKARVKDDGTLAGSMSSDANDMVFVGKRAK